MRVYITTTNQHAQEIIKQGFIFTHTIGEMDLEGVIVGEKPLDINDGVAGQVTLCVNLPDEVFGRHEILESDPGDPAGSTERRTGRAIVPPEVLNQHGPAQVYDHLYAGVSRRELLQAIRRWEEVESQPEMATEMRAAMEFIDGIGWLTPVRLQEEKPNS